jgi:hypothetical protein
MRKSLTADVGAIFLTTGAALVPIVVVGLTILALV